MGPEFGLPQLMISRRVFGGLGGMVPALLNYLSTIGWFSVNNILGSFALRVLFPALHYWQAAGMLVIIQGLLAIFGHNLIHLYERVMSLVLGVLFVVVSIILLEHPRIAAYHPTLHFTPWASIALVIAAALSYLGSWAPYASDYSRYLPQNTPRGQVRRASFWGGFIASLWLELVGAGVAVVVRSGNGNPISALYHVTGGLGDVAVAAIVLGGTAADALNLYSNALAAGAMRIPLPRWSLAIIASGLGLSLSLLGSGSFEQYYDNFLLVLGYWLTPWLGVMLVDFYARRTRGDEQRHRNAIAALVSFLVALLASIPFMSSSLYEGPVAKALGGADLTFYVGFLLSAFLYGLWVFRRIPRQDTHTTHCRQHQSELTP